MKFYYITHEERNGDKEYLHHSVRSAKNLKEATKFANENASDWYGNNNGDEDDEFLKPDERGWYDYGEVMLRVYDIKEIPEDHYDIVRMYL